ncbi:MAG TPA: cupredoxin domain-containing protein [Mycobacteriales bacterium]|jgi:plastocyanin|nr:cupredoxin domain-containing protein [Mycobacteriales bacterium]
MRHLAACTALLCLAATACAGGDGDTAAAPSDSGAPTTTAAATPSASAPVTLNGPVNDHGTKDLAGDDEIELELDDFYFGPTYIKATPGTKLRLELKNEGAAPHTFTIDALHVDETLKPDEERPADITLPASGVVAFYCKFHKSQGMQGAIYFTAGGTAPSGAPSGSASGDGGAYGQ